MWLGIGYLIPQKGDKSGGAAPLPSTFYIMAESGTTTELQTEDGTSLMIQEVAP
tara:strand:+ start:758 stop:919 length:162 start_codon:yes stop_codon:yes gene_type:complete